MNALRAGEARDCFRRNAFPALAGVRRITRSSDRTCRIDLDNVALADIPRAAGVGCTQRVLLVESHLRVALSRTHFIDRKRKSP